MDNRKSVRYRLGASAVFSWEDSPGNRLRGEGVTRDISLVGAFIFTATCPPANTPVQLDVFLPPVQGRVPTARIRAKTQVLRIEGAEGVEELSGFAVVSQGFRFWPLWAEDPALDLSGTKLLRER